MAGAVLLTGGCAGSDPSPPGATAKATIESREAYLQSVRAELPDGVNLDDAGLEAAGRDICVALDSGESIRDIYNATAAGGLDPSMGMAIARGAVTHLCPEHSDATQMIDRLTG